MERFKSKKFIMVLLACVVCIIKVFIPDFPEESFWTIVGSLMTYVVAQGAVDTAKAISEPKKAENIKVGGTE